jgi:hypothetical protein
MQEENQMLKRWLSLAFVTLVLVGYSPVSSSKTIDGTNYVYPVDHLKVGQSLGNSNCYVTLDNKTDIWSDPTSVRYGLRESTNQKYYLLGWDVGVVSPDGAKLTPTTTTFTPTYQESEYEAGAAKIRKKFFVPFETGYLRSAHFLLNAETPPATGLTVQSRIVFPDGVQVEQAGYKDHQYLRAVYPDGAVAILWGSATLKSVQIRNLAQESSASTLASIPTSKAPAGQPVEAQVEFTWNPSESGPPFALSFAYALDGGDESVGMLLGAVFDPSNDAAPGAAAHLERVEKLLADSMTAIDRSLAAGRLWTPDAVIERGSLWAKINQLRMHQEYEWGDGFSNNPPSDVVVGRDSYWYLSGSSYYAQPWSRLLLNLWFEKGLEPSGEFVEYMTASRRPIFTDDYGLNVNDNTPLLLIAAYRYYALSGDQEFLHRVYPLLLQSANFILSQRQVGKNNRYGLVWCTSTETFVRGLCGWRNCIRNYKLSGAVTEVNVECFEALLRVAELAKSQGDDLNATRLTAAAEDLKLAINQHLRASTPTNHFYCLNINSAGERVEDTTADLLFPVLSGVTDRATGQAIMKKLFGEDFWASAPDGAGGIRTVSSEQKGYEAESTPGNYGLMGGVWPNLALWAGKAAAAEGLPELAVKGMQGTFLLSEREDAAHYNVVPGEFPEYFNGDDLKQRGMPLSPFVPGIYLWCGLEGLAGLNPRPSAMRVEPQIPRDWDWLAISRLPYRGYPLTLLAAAKEHTIYTTAPVETDWKQIEAPADLQEKYELKSDKPAFWMVVPKGKGREVLAASAEAVTGTLVERGTDRVVAKVAIPAKALVRFDIN